MKAILFVYEIILFLPILQVGARAPLSYVALGDSFAAGLGGGRDLSESCGRTSFSFSELFYRSHPTIQIYKNMACKQQYLNDIQKQQAPAINATTELVSITAGLYDLDMHHTISYCDIEYDEHQCSYGVTVAEGILNRPNAYYSPHKRMLNLVLDVKKRSRDAVVVIIGYPAFYSPPVANCFTWDGVKQMNEDYKARLNTVIRRLNDKYRIMAEILFSGSQPPVIFKNPDDRFEGHRVCDNDFYLKQYPGTVPMDFWLDAWSKYGYYHPVRGGHYVYRDLLNEAWIESQGRMEK